MLNELFIQSSDPAVQPMAVLEIENAIMEKPANTGFPGVHGKYSSTHFHVQNTQRCFTICNKILGQAGYHVRIHVLL